MVEAAAGVEVVQVALAAGQLLLLRGAGCERVRLLLPVLVDHQWAAARVQHEAQRARDALDFVHQALRRLADADELARALLRVEEELQDRDALL